MNDIASFLINEEFTRTSVTAAELDRLLAEGWRHFGRQFFRYNLALYENEVRLVIPLRVRLSGFRLSRGQRRAINRNADVVVNIEPVRVTPEMVDLFDRHTRRFRQHPPDDIHAFVAERPDDEPCDTFQQTLRLGGRLLAAGFFDAGERSVSGIYTSFDPDETRRSLGIFTILKEIEFAIATGREFYYLGYCYNGSSFYDYKKLFHGTEAFAWNGTWTSVPRNFS